MIDRDTDINDPAFNAWCDQLDDYAKNVVGMVGGSHTLGTGRDCWLRHYEEGMTPKEALEDDFSNI